MKELTNLLYRLAAHQLRMGQAINLILESIPKEFINPEMSQAVLDYLGTQNHFLQRAIEERKGT